MSKKVGNIFIVIGSFLILSSIVLLVLFYQEDRSAEKSSSAVMTQIVESITADTAQNDTDDNKTLEIDGNEYIGYISIPSLSIELPVVADWNYNKLKIAPCTYYGSIDTDNLVIAAHNYTSHFSNLSNMSIGDDVYITRVDGTIVHYKVEATDILMPSAIEEMLNGEYDLTLFTCTYGARSRVTVRCTRYTKSIDN